MISYLAPITAISFPGLIIPLTETIKDPLYKERLRAHCISLYSVYVSLSLPCHEKTDTSFLSYHLLMLLKMLKNLSTWVSYCQKLVHLLKQNSACVNRLKKLSITCML